MEARNGEADDLPPPPLNAGDEPLKVEEIKVPLKPKRSLVPRNGFGKRGQPIKLVTNHFKVSLKNTEEFFYHYYVNLKYEDDTPVDRKEAGRKVIDKLRQTYAAELANKDFAYDGEKSLFTIGALPQRNDEFTVVVEDSSTGKTPANGSPNDSPPGGDRKRVRRPYNTKTYKVGLSYAAKIPMSAIAQALTGQESEHTQEAIRVIDIILRQHSAKQGCLLVRQSFFHNNPANFVALGGGVMGFRGFHSSFRATQSGLSLNIDASTTMIVKPGPVIDFLLDNQNVPNPDRIDWSKAKHALKNLRIKTSPANSEFTLKHRNGDNGDLEEISVYDYFVKNRGIELRYSGGYPCINLCNLVSLQRYTKALSTFQRSSLVEKSRKKPLERMEVLSKVLQRSNYNSEPMLMARGIAISKSFTEVDGRVLQAPKLKAGNGEDIFTRNGRWNFNNKMLIRAGTVEKWAVVNFSACCNIRNLVQDLVKCGDMKGIRVDQPTAVFDENPSMRRAPAVQRVENMLEQVKTKLRDAPKFFLCVLAERKNSDIYGPWKKKCLSDYGIVTQCVAPPTRVTDQYLTNVLLKINAKLGALNSMLQVETALAIPLVPKVPTLILGMDVSHGSPGQSDIPSIAAVVSSQEWPLISKYRTSVRSQSPRMEMIDSLFKPYGTGDDGLIQECLFDFYTSSGRMKPDKIIIFRDGVSESQFNQVLNIELDQIIEACKFLDDDEWNPKFTLIVAQKNHHTKFFMPGKPDNVPPGTVVDNKVCHPRNYDFYMGLPGLRITTFFMMRLASLLMNCWSWYQRSTTAISVVAPIYYAHLAAAQVGQFIKYEEMSETSSSHGGHTSAGSVPVQELPRLHKNVRSSMSSSSSCLCPPSPRRLPAAPHPVPHPRPHPRLQAAAPVPAFGHRLQPSA
ncbi:hypothetical protein U9M48_020181 [Paspalum notatum var. saurae]|uniref:Argonaute 4 n=1 Tax=Paspalum notatum var. saurae TaxID=547442 RepID=A0AAQ3TEZ9_PASNO